MRAILKALPLGVGLPLIIFFASVGPDDAASNVSKWAARVGIHDLPAWLIYKAADKWTIGFAIVLALIYALFAYVFPIRRQLRKWFYTDNPKLIGIQIYYRLFPTARERAIARNIEESNRILNALPTLEELIDKEFPRTTGSSTSSTQTAFIEGAEREFRMHVYNDSYSNAQFVVFAVLDDNPIKYAVCMHIAKAFDDLKDKFMDSQYSSHGALSLIPSGKARMVFTGRVYIYSSGQMSVQQMHDIQGAFRDAGADDVYFKDLLVLYRQGHP